MKKKILVLLVMLSAVASSGAAELNSPRNFACNSKWGQEGGEGTLCLWGNFKATVPVKAPLLMPARYDYVDPATKPFFFGSDANMGIDRLVNGSGFCLIHKDKRLEISDDEEACAWNSPEAQWNFITVNPAHKEHIVARGTSPQLCVTYNPPSNQAVLAVCDDNNANQLFFF